MSLPTSYAGAAPNIRVGQHTVAASPQRLAVNVNCRRVLLVADAGTVFVGGPNVTTSSGMLLPAPDATGNFTPLELWVNATDILWIVGAGSETVYWIAELDE